MQVFLWNIILIAHTARLITTTQAEWNIIGFDIRCTHSLRVALIGNLFGMHVNVVGGKVIQKFLWRKHAKMVKMLSVRYECCAYIQLGNARCENTTYIGLITICMPISYSCRFYNGVFYVTSSNYDENIFSCITLCVQMAVKKLIHIVKYVPPRSIGYRA